MMHVNLSAYPLLAVLFFSHVAMANSVVEKESSSVLKNEQKTAQSVMALAESKLEYQGYYIKVKGEYYPIGSVEMRWEFGFNKLQQIKYAPVGDGDFTIVVFKDDWKPDEVSFFAPRLAFVNHNNIPKLTPRVKRLADNRFEIKFDNLSTDQILMIRDASGLYATGLGEISQKLVDLFSSTSEPPHVVYSDLKDALKSFPENKILQYQLPIWKVKREYQRADSAWNNVLEDWEKYDVELDRESKLVHATSVEREIRYYLSFEIDLKNAPRAKKMQAAIEAFRIADKASRNARVIEIPNADDIKGAVTRYRSHGPHNITVTFVNVGDDGDVLIRFKGTPNEHDDLVYRHEKEIQNSSTGSFIFKTEEIGGSRRNSFSFESSGWGGDSTFIYAPGMDDRIDVILDNDADDPIEDPQQLFKDYVYRISKK